MKHNRLRIDNIELRKTKYKDSPYEFVKWYPNQYYKQEDKMLKEGYIDTGWSLTKVTLVYPILVLRILNLVTS